MMKISRTIFILCALSAFSFSHAQAATIPFFAKYPQLDNKLWYISNGWTNGPIQSCEWRADAIGTDEQRLKITLSNKGGKIAPYGCGEVQSMKKMTFGVYEVSMRSAKGSGLNSNFFTYTGDPVHDEIDFEFLGKNPKTVQVNYFANNKNYGGVNINLGFDASAAFHTYKFVWEPTRITWFVDGKQVFQTKVGAKNLPLHPQRFYMSLWSGSKTANGWLGPFNYTAPASAEYEWVRYTPLDAIPTDASGMGR